MIVKSIKEVPTYKVVHPECGVYSEGHYAIGTARFDRMMADMMYGGGEARVYDSLGNNVTFIASGN